jgi:branched-subunit amino acid ABC-type transport system permease component
VADFSSFLLAVFSLFGFYALLAFGLGLIFGQLGVVNIAQGDFAMVGAYTMFVLDDVPFLLRLLIATGVGIVLGMITEKLLLSRLYARGFLATLLAMWGVGIILRQSVEAIWSSTPRSVASPVTETVEIFGAAYPLYRLIAASASLVIVAMLVIAAYKTSLGLRLRASIDNKEMAGLLGISTRAMMTGTFTLGIVLAVLAGAVQSPILGVTPGMGIAFLAPAFFAVLLGKPGSIGGPLIGALIVAVLSTTLRYFFTEALASSLFFLALIILIAFKPQGINWRSPKWNRTIVSNPS